MNVRRFYLKNFPFNKFLSIWTETKEKRVVFTILISLLILSSLFTRIMRLEIKYQALNPVRDKVMWEKITKGGRESKEFQKLLSSGSLAHAETLYLPPSIVLKAISTGYECFLSDLLFIRAHSYFLSHFFTDRIFEWLDSYVEGILSLDKDNPKVYLWAGQVLKYGQIIDNHLIKRSNEYFEKGIEKFPEDWRFYERIGFNLFFEYKPENEVEKKVVREKALHYFSLAAGLPGSKLPANFIADLFIRKNEYRLALEHAYQLYYEATDEEKEQIRRLIATIEKNGADDIKKEEEAWKNDFPYSSIHLYQFLGEKINPYTKEMQEILPLLSL